MTGQRKPSAKEVINFQSEGEDEIFDKEDSELENE